MQEKQVIRSLNWAYYAMMIISLIALTGMYYGLLHDWYMPIDKQSTLGMVIQYIVIFDALITIPGGLYGFKHLCEPLQTKEDRAEQLKRYRKIALWRIVLVSSAMPLGIIAFYWLGAYKSMLWVAAIAAIAWYFTKPSEAKMEIELTPKQPNEENY